MMLRIPTRGRSPSLQHGVTLIELMVAMVLGLLVAGGIITVFSSTSSSSKAQTQLARLQEEGRFAITRLASDLRMANGQYCNNSGGAASAAANGTLLDQLRAPRVYAKALIGPAGAISGALADISTPFGTAPYPAAPTAPYAMPAFLYMRGYDCTLTACTPVDPHTPISSIPKMGTAVGDRVKGADVITVRYVNSDAGWTIVPSGSSTGSTITTASSGGVDSLASVTINPLPGEPPAADFGGSDLAMLADCSSAQIFGLSSVASGVLTVDTAASVNLTTTPPPVPNPQSAPKLFDVNRDFRTVTYYLRVVSVNNDNKAPFTGALIRRVNGGQDGITAKVGDASEDELVRGVERMDFRYGVEDANGNTAFLSAADVDSATNCPPQEPGALTATGCLWRSVKSIEVNLLMDGQVPLYTLSADNLKYAYSADTTTPGLLAPSGHAIKPSDQGFPDQLLRREFSALVAVRNFNP
jgi:type IV pilus assembly protein PilW